MITGRHMVRDVSCKNCNAKLGWMYEYAHEKTQTYKEGKVILERALIAESDGMKDRRNVWLIWILVWQKDILSLCYCNLDYLRDLLQQIRKYVITNNHKAIRGMCVTKTIRLLLMCFINKISLKEDNHYDTWFNLSFDRNKALKANIPFLWNNINFVFSVLRVWYPIGSAILIMQIVHEQQQ